MLRLTAALLVALATTAPLVVSLPAPSAPVVVPGTIGDGETREYRDGTFYVVGNVTVESGGAIAFERADVVFVGGDWVITIEDGGRLDSRDTTMRPDPAWDALTFARDVTPGGAGDALPVVDDVVEHGFKVDVLPGAIFALTDTIVQDGHGVVVDSSSTTIENVAFLRNEIGLTLRGVDIAIDGLNFTDNLVGLSIEGGAVSITDAWFDRNADHIAARDADVTIEDTDVLSGVHGLDLEGGSAILRRNTFREHMGPDSVGAFIRSADSATFDANIIEHWERNVIIQGTPTTFTGNTVSSPTEDERQLLEIAYGTEEAEESHVVSNNTFTSGWASIQADDTPGDVVVENNTLVLASLSISRFEGVVQYNDGSGTLSVAGPMLVRKNDFTGVDGDRAHISVYEGAALVENTVTGSGACFYVASSTSIGNTASECTRGFTFVGFGDVSSTGDRYLRATLDDESSYAAVELRGRDGAVTGLYVERAPNGIYVTPEEENDGGWNLSGVEVRESINGIFVRSDVWDVTIWDSDIEDNERGIVTVARDTYVDRTRIRDNAIDGIRVSGGTVLGSQNWIAGNAVGVYLESAGHATLEDCYWGAADGPWPTGSGNGVSPGVDHTPFLTSPPS